MKSWLPSSRVEVRDGDRPKKFFMATRRPAWPADASRLAANWRGRHD
jgi:hypothetical protein